MRAAVIHKPFVKCPTPRCGSTWSVDHIPNGERVTWVCKKCGLEYRIIFRSLQDADIEHTGRLQTPVTVTLVSETVPPITVKLHSWKYPHSQDDSPEEYFRHQEFFYGTHTCPTNWTSEIDQMSIPGNKDPHGLFKLVSIVDGHEEDPSVIG